jgi:hypothetical protein
VITAAAVRSVIAASSVESTEPARASALKQRDRVGDAPNGERKAAKLGRGCCVTHRPRPLLEKRLPAFEVAIGKVMGHGRLLARGVGPGAAPPGASGA